MKKQLAIAGLIAGVGVAGVTGIGIAHAATTTTQTSPMSGLVEAIATKFNLKTADVQAVVDTQKTKQAAERETQLKAEIAQLVKDGKLTQTQADQLNTKRAELQKQRETDRADNKSLSETERKTKREKERTDLEAWAKQTGIATEYLRYVMGGGHHGGRPMLDTPASDTAAPTQ